MTNGQVLARGNAQNTLISSDSRWNLILGNDGNLRLWDESLVPPNPIWSSNTSTAVVAWMNVGNCTSGRSNERSFVRLALD